MTGRQIYYKNEIENIAIVWTLFIVIFTPFYIYGIIKWKQFQYHLFIQKRFPKLSCSIICFSYLMSIIGAFGRWIQFTDLDQFLLIYAAAAGTQFICNLTNLRLLFVYLTFTQNQSQQNVRKHNLYHHGFVKLSLIFTFAIFMYSIFCGGRPEWLLVFLLGWIVNFIVSIVLIIILYCYKVNDGIGCMKETICMLAVIFITWLINLLQRVNSLVIVIIYIQNIWGLIFGLIVLYGPLYYIYHFEGTLDVNIWKSMPQSEVFAKHTVSIDNLGDMYEIKQSDSTSLDKEHILKQYEENAPLSVFLDSESGVINYGIFKEYLNFCWSVDNLLFVERVSVIYQIMCKYESNSNNNLYRFQFKYLHSIYDEYETIIDDINMNNNNNIDTFEKVKTQLDSVYTIICRQFIENGAINEINISNDTRNSLLFIMNDDFNKLKSFDDYLNFFNDALVEIYQLMISVYRYQFSQYVQTHC